MRIQVIGAAGYVGSVTAACLAEAGNEVLGVDSDPEKVAALRAGKCLIHEPGLLEMLQSTIASGRLSFTQTPDLENYFDVIFITIGTPNDASGALTTEPIKQVVRDLAPALGNRQTLIVIKSTVPVGTCRQLCGIMKEHGGLPQAIASNPEFLKEGLAIGDFKRPDRIVIGTQEDFATDVLKELYAPFLRSGNPLIVESLETAEFSKLAANAMLAMRISAMNQFAELAEATGANIDGIRRIIGSDERIGHRFLYPGPGYGGSCFPKDVRGLTTLARQLGVPVPLLEATEEVNQHQQGRLFLKLQKLLPALRDKHVAVWGLAFKPETDDVRESPALPLINSLMAAGANICAYDPKANHNAARMLGSHPPLEFSPSAMKAAAGADALVIVTDWNEFKTPDWKILAETMRTKILLDGRNLFRPDVVRNHGFLYDSIGRP